MRFSYAFGIKAHFMKKYTIILLAAFFLVNSSCVQKKENHSKSPDRQKTFPEYATRFSLGEYQSYPVLFLHNPWQPDEIDHKVLCVPHGKEVPDSSDSYKVIRTPIRSIVTMSGTQIASLNILKQLNTIKGVGDKRLIKQPYLKSKIKNNRIRQVGTNGNFNNEILIDLSPDVILVSPFKGQSNNKLNELDLNIFPYSDYMEQHPLGRAEWIKVLGVLYEKQEMAWEYFEKVRDRYLKITKLTDTLTNRPTVFSGKPYGGVWYMPGGNSYMAHFFEDAGAEYLWNTNQKTSSLSLDFETVYAKAYQADFWKLVVKSQEDYSYKQLLSEDKRYGDFKAFRERQIILCNVAHSPYYEKGALEPDVVLADFIHAFHPELLGTHQPEYFKKLTP